VFIGARLDPPAASTTTWFNGHGPHPYNLEPISPSSPPPSSYHDVMDTTSSDSSPPSGHWTSSPGQQLAIPRRWNGDGGHPYSPLKRVLHQYRNGVGLEPEDSPRQQANSYTSSGTATDTSTSRDACSATRIGKLRPGSTKEA